MCAHQRFDAAQTDLLLEATSRLLWFCLINDEQYFFSMVCVKRGAVIEADKSIHSQLRLINFSEGSPYETLHAFISKTMAPYFKSYVKESGRADR